MAKDKNFITYNQQMRKLRNDKKIDCSGSKDKRILIRMGYFNIVNGYKSPFTCGVDSNGDHVYLPNTSLEHLYELKQFDDNLRLFLLKYITQIEEEIRTLTGYKFDQCNNDGKIPWYDSNAYSPTSRLQNRMSAISSAYSELSSSQLDYVKFYMENHTSIPTWIMIKMVNFSTFIDILKNSKTGVTHSLCKLYDMYDSNGKPNVKLLIGSLHWLRKVRNSCAHNERIFDLLVYFKYYLPDKEYKKMMSEFQQMITDLQSGIFTNAFDNIRGQMGIKNLADLEALKTLPKAPILYNSFDTFV